MTQQVEKSGGNASGNLENRENGMDNIHEIPTTENVAPLKTEEAGFVELQIPVSNSKSRDSLIPIWKEKEVRSTAGEMVDILGKVRYDVNFKDEKSQIELPIFSTTIRAVVLPIQDYTQLTLDKACDWYPAVQTIVNAANESRDIEALVNSISSMFSGSMNLMAFISMVPKVQSQLRPVAITFKVANLFVNPSAPKDLITSIVKDQVLAYLPLDLKQVMSKPGLLAKVVDKFSDSDKRKQGNDTTDDTKDNLPDSTVDPTLGDLVKSLIANTKKQNE